MTKSLNDVETAIDAILLAAPLLDDPEAIREALRLIESIRRHGVDLRVPSATSSDGTAEHELR
jgi:hypothetical protein